MLLFASRPAGKRHIALYTLLSVPEIFPDTQAGSVIAQPDHLARVVVVTNLPSGQRVQYATMGTCTTRHGQTRTHRI